jgi:hypothetical protein
MRSDTACDKKPGARRKQTFNHPTDLPPTSISQDMDMDMGISQGSIAT